MEISPGRAPFDVDDDCTPLRKPHIREAKKTLTNNGGLTPPKSPSRLSPTAQEFIPKSSQSNGLQTIVPSSSVQQRLIRNQHPNAYVAGGNSSLYQPNVSSITSSIQNRLNIHDRPQSDLNSNYLQPSEIEIMALNYLASVIQCLNENPGSFDTVATKFLTIFDGMENNQFVLSNAMEDIFKESIENPNFRYMGAKLYNLLHMLNLRDDSLFHMLLKCKLDYHQIEVMEFMQNNSEQKVRETALFLAELYMQLRGDDSRIKLIAENIVFSLKQLLTKISPDNLRCICLTLKLAGYDLDTDCRNEINSIMQKLDTINREKPGKYPLVQNVISLKKNNWGRTVQQDNTILYTNDSRSQAPTEATLYGPDGKILTDEESQFLHKNAPKSLVSSGDDDEYDLDVDLDPEMDEDTEKEYRKFCKLNK